MKNIQNWTVIDGDTTLRRACKKNNLSDVCDYQKDHLKTSLKYCKHMRNAVDIGAHYGIMTYNLSQFFKHVYSFEINHQVFDCLKENVAKFKTNNITLYPFGLGSAEKNVYLNFNPESTFSTHVCNDVTAITSEIKKLDSFNLHNIDFIKIDAEGYEPFILQGGLQTIIENKPVILYECKNYPDTRYGISKDFFYETLSRYGYKILDNVGSKNKLIGV